jgi:hypothetical protein
MHVRQFSRQISSSESVPDLYVALQLLHMNVMPPLFLLQVIFELGVLQQVTPV